MLEENSGDTDKERTESGRRYLLITPCRNEEQFIGTTLRTTCGQSVPPSQWIIVDDGSTDDTARIVEEYAERFPYIRLIRRKDRGQRAVGPGVIEAFAEGLRNAELQAFDYVAKFDADLEMPPRYFERAMELMEADPILGNVSGKLFERLEDDSLLEEKTGDENAVGPVKFYRTSCYSEIGGFVREVAWDGIDGHICRLNGWIAQSCDDPELRIIHLRPMGSSQQNIIVGRVRWGRGKYFMGSAWYFVVASAIYRALERPYVIGSAAMLFGYFKAMFGGHLRYDNPKYRRYLRRFERAQLIRGKRAALERENARVRGSAPSPRLNAVSIESNR